MSLVQKNYSIKFGETNILAKATILSPFISGICVKKWEILLKNPNTSKPFGGVGIKLKNELKELHKVQFSKVYREQLIQVLSVAIMYTALGVAVYLLTANLLR